MRDNVNTSPGKYDTIKITARVISNALALGVMADKVKATIGAGQGYTFDESYQQNQQQLEKVDRISDNVKYRFVALPQYVIDNLNENHPDQHAQIEKLDALWAEKIKAIDEAIAKKILEEREEEERKLQKKQSEQLLNVAQQVNNNIEDEKKENADSLKYRIFASLIFSGILDVTDILECVINIFGINEDFAKGVGDVVGKNGIMGFLGEVNSAFGIDKLVEQVSRIPILNDINQTALEISNTDAFQTFSPLAKEILTGDLAEYGFRALSLTHMALGESELRENHEKRRQDNDDKIRELEELIREEAKPDAMRIATRAIDVETRLRLDEIYMRNYLKAVIKNPDQFNESDQKELNRLIIRDENKENCGTLFDRINEAKDVNEAEKIEKIQKIIELVVEDKGRNNMDVLDSFRTVARERFYKLELPTNEIQEQREKYLKEEVLKGLELDGNEYKKEAAQEVLKEAMKTQYAGNDNHIATKNTQISALSTPDEFADFIKKQFQGNKQFDEIVTKIAISVKKDEIAQTVVRSPFHRVIPAPIVGTDSASVISATHVVTGTAKGAEASL